MEPALRSIDTAIETDPSDPESYRVRAEFLREVGRFEEALADIDAALALQPDDATLFRRRAALLADLGRTEEQVLALEQAVDGPDAVRARHDLVRALLRADRHDEAVAVAEELEATALRLADREGRLWPLQESTRAWLVLNQAERAMTVVERAIELDPNWEHLILRAGAHAAAGDLPKTIEDCNLATLDETQDINKSYWFARRMLDYCGYSGISIAAFDALIERVPNWADPWMARARSRAAQRQGPAALDDLDSASERAPRWHAVPLERAIQLRDLGRVDAASEAFTTAMRLAPEWAAPYAERGEMHLAANRPAEALADLDRAVRLHPGDEDYYAARAAARRRLDDLKGALDDIDTAISFAPGWSDFWLTRSHVLMEMGRPQPALEAAERARATGFGNDPLVAPSAAGTCAGQPRAF